MLGLQSQVTVGAQPVIGTANTTQRTNLNIYKIDGGSSASLPDDNILSGGFNNGSDPTPPAPGLVDHKLQIDVPLCVNQFPLWLLACFGASTDSGTNPNYTHSFASGAANPAGVTIEHQLQTSDYRRHLFCVMDSFSLDLSADKEGFAMASLGFMGYDEIVQTAALAGTVTAAPALSRPAQALLNILYNGVSGAGQIMGGKINFKRNLKRHRRADGTGLPYEISYDNRSELSGSLHVRYKDGALNADAIALTTRSLEMDLMSGTNTGLKFVMNNIVLERTPVPVQGPSGVEYDINFKGWQTAGAPAITASVLNQTATVSF